MLLYRPPVLKNTGLWFVFVAAAFLTWAAVSFIQLPLQSWSKGLQLLKHFRLRTRVMPNITLIYWNGDSSNDTLFQALAIFIEYKKDISRRERFE